MMTNINANPLETGSDELERYVLEECIKRQRLDHRVSTLVMPAARCDLASKLARLGAKVTVSGPAGHRREAENRILAAGFSDEIHFAAFNWPELPETLPGEPFDAIVVRRELSTLPYLEARQMVRQLLLKLRIGGKLYLSVLGLHSELADDYAASESPLEGRFGPLAPKIARTYDINGSVCLYTERELFLLLLEAGASVLRTLTATYGNVKAVAVRV